MIFTDAGCVLLIGKKWIKATLGGNYMFRNFQVEHVRQQMVAFLQAPGKP
ncbi:MAG: hypothetical protein IPM74_10890 [Crocinitomicaceae bacterium]|nr:hypothetical protein [Crocinitomicaceae bacterium]